MAKKQIDETVVGEKVKKPIYKKWWFWVIIAVVLIAIFASSGNGNKEEVADHSTETVENVDNAENTTQAEDTNTTERTDDDTESTTDAAKEAIEAVESQSANSDDNLSVDACVSLMKIALDNNFGDDYEITVDDNIVSINVWGSGVTLGAIKAQSGDEESINQWNTMVDSMISMSNSMQSVLSENDHDDVVVMTNVLNDTNHENLLLSVSYGTVIYDTVNGINFFE